MFARLPFLVILLTVLIDAIGIGLILPVMPDLLREVTGDSLGASAVWGGMLSAVFAVMQFLCGPVVGGLSDRFGRRPVILVSLGAVAADYVLMALAHTLPLLFLGRVIGGVASSTHATAMAYIADLSRDEDKARNFGLLGAVFGLGFVLGPLLGGLLGQMSPRAPFWAAAALAGGNAVLGAFVLTETVTDAIRRPFTWARANPFGAFRAIGQLPGMARFLWVHLLYGLALYTYAAIWSFYGVAQFGWDARLVGLSFTVYGIGMALVQGALVAPAIRRLGEGRTVMAGMAVEIVSFLFFGIIATGWIALALTPFTALGGVVTPALTAVMSRRARPDQQGELQGVLASLTAVTMVVSPLVMTRVFSAFTAPGGGLFLPGMPFLLAAVLMAVAMVLFATRQRLGRGARPTGGIG